MRIFINMIDHFTTYIHKISDSIISNIYFSEAFLIFLFSLLKRQVVVRFRDKTEYSFTIVLKRRKYCRIHGTSGRELGMFCLLYNYCRVSILPGR